MQDNQLGGTLPASLAALTRLQKLRLGYNKLAGPLPAAWAGLSSLQTLDLRQNSLTNALPQACALLDSASPCLSFGMRCQPSTFQLTCMTSHSICAFHDVHGRFAECAKTLSGLLQAWSALANLQQLLLDHNALTGNLPGSYHALTNLRILTLGEGKARICFFRGFCAPQAEPQLLIHVLA